jgi:hypothetical protein
LKDIITQKEVHRVSQRTEHKISFEIDTGIVDERSSFGMEKKSDEQDQANLTLEKNT